MRRRYLALAAFTAFTTMAGAQTQQQNFGLGIILGGPTGLSAKIPAGPANSINAILAYQAGGPDGWGWGNRCRGTECDDGRMYLGADYVWYNFNLTKVSQGWLPLYYGPGVNATLGNRSRVGVRFAVGLEYMFANAPFDIFLEVAPGINVIPDTRGTVHAGVGGRFFF